MELQSVVYHGRFTWRRTSRAGNCLSIIEKKNSEYSHLNFSPVDRSKVEPLRLSGTVFVWQWVRYFSPFINLYALIFLVGGAIYSAILYFSKKGSSARAWGNVMIAVGALLPGIGGSATRLGHVEVLYITEFIGLCLIFS